MSIHPLARPLSLPADPALTGGRRVAVLLSHGFTGSPASVRPWGEALARHGYGVEVPRLPGHGTTWRDLNRTTWADWHGELERTLDRLLRDNDDVVVGGLSMGGTLALRLAADRGDELAGVAVVNPAVATLRKDVLALPLLKWVVPSFPAIAGDVKKPGVTEHGYTRTPLKAAHSMMSQWKPLRADLGRITAPVLLFRSADDHVVDASSLAFIRSALASHDLTVRTLADSFHVATLDHDAPLVFAETAAFVARVTGTGAGGGTGPGEA